MYASELCVEDTKKTIRPTSIGGLAGGQKFIVGGIIFKIAGDVLIQNDPPFWMYGGKGNGMIVTIHHFDVI